MSERSRTIRIEREQVSVYVNYRPWGSDEPVRKWFSFRDGIILDPELYSIPRADRYSLPRVLRSLGRYNRRSNDPAEINLLNSVRARVQAIIKSGRIWPEEF